MENCCWNCGGPSHHRRACKEPSNPELRKKIKEAYDKGPGREHRLAKFSIQKEKMALRTDLFNPDNLPPVVFLDKEVERLGEVLHQIKSSIEDLEGPVGADVIVPNLEKVSTHRKQLEAELNNISFINVMKKAYRLHLSKPGSQEDILMLKIDDLLTNQKLLSNLMFVTENQLSCAQRVDLHFVDFKVETLRYIEAAKRAFDSGRPLEVMAANASWQQKKKMIQTTEEMLEKYMYLFDDATNSLYRGIMADLKLNWKELKAIKRESETIMPKTFCSICRGKEVDHAIIPCGHTFCKSCLDRIKTCAKCRKPKQNILRIFFD